MSLQIVTLNEIKQQCRIEPDFDMEDELLTMYGEAAEQVTLATLNRTLDELTEKFGDVPVPVKYAVLMLAAHSYNQREPVSMTNMYAVPYTYDHLIKPYMKL